VPQAINIGPDDYNSLVEMIEAKASNKGNPWKFESLFTYLKNDHNPKFITKGPNRYLTSTRVYMEALGNWIDLKNVILSQLATYGFPKRKKLAREHYLDFTMLKSDPNLKLCQDAHNDFGIEYASKGKADFDFVIIVGVEEYSFLDIKPCADDEEPMRVLIERGDIFLMRSDIPHCGCENFTDRTHYRIHVFCEEVKTDDIATIYAGSARKSSRPFPPGPYFDTITGLFHYGRRIY